MSPLRSVCPPNPVHHPTRHLPGWGHDTPPRADLKSGLCLLPCLKHSKGFSQFLACPTTVCTHSCEQRPCSTGTPRTPQLLGSTTSHTGSCGAHLHHSCHLLPCPAAQPSRPQEDSLASHPSRSRTPRQQAKQLPCPSACGTRNALRAAMVFHLPWQLCSSLSPKNKHFNNAKTRQAQPEQAAAQAADVPQPPAVTRHVTAPLPTGRDRGQLNYLHDPFG